MSALNNQHQYWDKVAATKTFTHPLDQDILLSFFQKTDKILDYGCGYGRLAEELYADGFLYISDYYLQDNTGEVTRYHSMQQDPDNYGVFSLPEGVVFRHYTKEWIKELLQDYEIVAEKMIPVTTMNGHSAEAFQLLARK